MNPNLRNRISHTPFSFSHGIYSLFCSEIYSLWFINQYFSVYLLHPKKANQIKHPSGTLLLTSAPTLLALRLFPTLDSFLFCQHTEHLLVKLLHVPLSGRLLDLYTKVSFFFEVTFSNYRIKLVNSQSYPSPLPHFSALSTTRYVSIISLLQLKCKLHESRTLFSSLLHFQCQLLTVPATQYILNKYFLNE